MEDLVLLPNKIHAKKPVFASIVAKVKNFFAFDGFDAPVYA